MLFLQAVRCAFSFAPANAGSKQCGENCNDGNHHQQFNQGECLLTPPHADQRREISFNHESNMIPVSAGATEISPGAIHQYVIGVRPECRAAA
jgi:hypothetical protein